MKKIFILLFCAGILLACNESDDYDPELTGKWKLAEVLADPGDGSGTFHKVSSKKHWNFTQTGQSLPTDRYVKCQPIPTLRL
jgi:hypothetical protein